MTSRREFLKTGFVAIVGSLVLKEYVFQRRIQMGGRTWNVFGKQELHVVPTILCRETFEPYRPLKPMFVMKEVGLSDNGEIRYLWTYIQAKQRVLCSHLITRERCWLTT